MKPPSIRKLRGYAVDPSYSVMLSTMDVNELVYQVPWEELGLKDESGKIVLRGVPAGEYLEIVDRDPASDRFYEPVNLDDPYLLAQDGLAPSVSDPQFHQQMVYAVMMTTIKNFEKALGRKIQWGENIPSDKEKSRKNREPLKFSFVQRLRVYPHALRQANAFYDPLKKTLLFGYFKATPSNAQLQLPGSTVFTCLSHDIIAHETTHALLDGLHRRYINATNPDTRAFHEAFSDIVAMLQHFSFPSLLKHQIAQTRGDLNKQNILGQLAQQFGKATGKYGSLRDAIGREDENGNWKPHVPNPDDYQDEMNFHARGSILVAAIFDAFLNIYQLRIRRTLRIASGGTGVLPDGELHPDLVDQLAEYASETAADVLRICIRALDYCPPMDITFGDFLRAIVTADIDMIQDDYRGYRVAFIEAFQKRGISVRDAKSLSVEELQHQLHPYVPGRNFEKVEKKVGEFLRELKNEIGYQTERKRIYEKTKKYIGEKKKDGKLVKKGLHRLLEEASKQEGIGSLIGLLFPKTAKECRSLGLEVGYLSESGASFAISNVWLANRVTPNGGLVNHVIVTLAQKRGVRFNVNRERDEVAIDEECYFVPDKTKKENWGEHHIIFNGGCTLIFNLDTLKLRYAIKKDIDDKERMIRQYRYEHGMMSEPNETYFDSKSMNALAGPFAFMHSCNDHNH